MYVFPLQARKRHRLTKEVQLVDALEVYQQQKSGELTVCTEKTVPVSLKTVSTDSFEFRKKRRIILFIEELERNSSVLPS